MKNFTLLKVKSKSYDNLIKIENKSKSFDNLVKLENISKSYTDLVNIKNISYEFNPIKKIPKKKIIKINNSLNTYSNLITIFNLNDFVPCFLNEIFIAKDYSESIRNIYRMIIRFNLLQNKNKIIIFLKTFLVLLKLYTLIFSIKIDYAENLLITNFGLLLDNI